MKTLKKKQDLENNHLNQCLTYRVVLPLDLDNILDDLFKKASIEVSNMLRNRDLSSSKYYKTVPCVLAKSLISKYQKNNDCKKVSNLVLPICGDKGKQVKLVDGGIRVPAIFKKRVIVAAFPRTIIGFIRQVEFKKIKKRWYMLYSYNTKKEPLSVISGKYIGVDRNSVGNVATISLPNKQVRHLGPCTFGINKNFKNRKRKLQIKGAKNALKKLSCKQKRRTRDINHKVSRYIVNNAKIHNASIVLEDLKDIHKSKSANGFIQKSNWSFSQLEKFLVYKASLLGIPVVYIDPRFTSQECNICGKINKTKTKKFKCSCGYFAHRDVNAALNISKRAVQGGFFYKNLSGCIGTPLNRGIGKAIYSKSSEVIR